MLKKGVLISVVVSIIIAFSSLVYSVVNLLANNKPTTTTIASAYRIGDKFSISGLKENSKDEITFSKTTDGEEAILKVDGNNITVQNEGELTITVKTVKGNTIIYNITVWKFGEGTAEDPINITRAEHLNGIDRKSMEALAKHYSIRNDIDLAGINWKPIGSRTHSFKGFIYGNGYTIKNLTINVTKDNLADFICVRPKDSSPSENLYYIDIGLLGCINGSVTNNAITGINLKDVDIKIFNINAYKDNTTVLDAIDARIKELNPSITTTFSVDDFRANTGSLVGNAWLTVIDGAKNAVSSVRGKITGKIQGFSSVGFVSYGIGGVIGAVECTELKNYDVDIIIDTTAAAGSYGGGLIGVAFELTNGSKQIEINNENVKFTVIKDCSVKASMIGDYKNGTRDGIYYETLIAGVVGYAVNTVIEDVVVDADMDMSRNAPPSSSEGAYYPYVSGVVGELKKYDYVFASGVTGTLPVAVATIRNCDVTIKATSATERSSSVAGVAIFINEGTSVVDTVVKGNIKGVFAAGLVFFNEGEILYTKDVGVAADVNILVCREGAGFVLSNMGSIIGYHDSSNGNYTKVKSVVKWQEVESSSSLWIKSGYDKLYYKISGFVVEAGGENCIIKFFDIDTSVLEGVNMGGVVCVFGSLTYSINGTPTAFVGGSISDIKASVNMVSTKMIGFFGFKTWYAGGFAAVVKDNVKIEDTTYAADVAPTIERVNVKTYINHSNAENSTYSGSGVGGFIGYLRSKVFIDACNVEEVKGTLTYTDLFGEVGGDSSKQFKIQYLGGFIGEIGEEDDIIARNEYIAGIKITNSSVKGGYLTSTVDSLFPVPGYLYVAGFIGSFKAGDNCELVGNSVSNIDIIGKERVAGFVGFINSGVLIEDNTVQINKIKGAQIGGLISAGAYMNLGTDNSDTVTVKGSSVVIKEIELVKSDDFNSLFGGIFASVPKANINRCYFVLDNEDNTLIVTASASDEKETIIGCFVGLILEDAAQKGLTVTDSFSYGRIILSLDGTESMNSVVASNPAAATVTATRYYYLKTTSESGSASAKTAEEMATLNLDSTYFELKIGAKYPTFK